MRIRPLTIAIPEPTAGKCNSICPLLGWSKSSGVCANGYHRTKIISIQGGPLWIALPGLGCPWYDADKDEEA